MFTFADLRAHRKPGECHGSTENTSAPQTPNAMARRLLPIFHKQMKKSDTNRPNAGSARESQAGRAHGAAMLNAILKLAYRRHARGRVALAAVTACLGR